MIGERAIPTDSCYPQNAKVMERFRPEGLQSSDSEGECGRRCQSSSPPIDDGSVNPLKEHRKCCHVNIFLLGTKREGFFAS